jgi:hypothetical protein
MHRLGSELIGSLYHDQPIDKNRQFLQTARMRFGILPAPKQQDRLAAASP